MNLTVIIDQDVLDLHVPDELIEQARDFHQKMDADMDLGWQMSRDWIPSPNQYQRCQIAADKLLTALENKDHNLGRLMAGYILARMPEIETIEFDLTGEMQHHDLQTGSGSMVTGGGAADIVPMDHDSDQYREAQKRVSDVYKVGKQYRFTVQNEETGKWEESPAFPDKEHAQRVRQMTIGKLARKPAS